MAVSNDLNIPSEAGNDEICKVRNKRRHKRHKMRRLYNRNTEKKQKTRAYSIWLSTVLISVATIVLYNQQNLSSSQAFSYIISKYTKQYKEIINNKHNYCARDMNTNRIFETLRHHVLHQELALNRLEIALRNQSLFQAVMLTGSSGVGKSYTTHVLRQTFDWPENVQSFAWNSYETDEARQLSFLCDMSKQFSHCGRNLLIIDNMTPYDHKIVPIFNKMILERQCDTNTALNKIIIIIYIFNINTLLTNDEHVWFYNSIQKEIPETTTIINYKSFNREELRDCIQNELKVQNMTMDAYKFDELLETINVEHTGCKTVHPKVLMYGDEAN